jgi:hypothetical protein
MRVYMYLTRDQTSVILPPQPRVQSSISAGAANALRHPSLITPLRPWYLRLFFLFARSPAALVGEGKSAFVGCVVFAISSLDSLVFSSLVATLLVFTVSLSLPLFALSSLRLVFSRASSTLIPSTCRILSTPRLCIPPSNTAGSNSGIKIEEKQTECGNARLQYTNALDASNKGRIGYRGAGGHGQDGFNAGSADEHYKAFSLG